MSTKEAVLKLIESKTVGDFEAIISSRDDLKNFRDENGNNVLHLVASQGHAVILKHLLESHECKDLIDVRDSQGLTPVDIAIQRSDCDLFDILVNHGADLSGEVGGESLIVYSSVAGKTSCVRTLIASGADPNSQTKDGLPLLFFLTAMVAMKRQSDASMAAKYHTIIRALLEGGASPNISGPGGFTPLHIAGEIGEVPLITTLLNHGANKEVRNMEQKTPADIAAEWEHVDAVQSLLYGKELESIDPTVALDAASRLIDERKKLAEDVGKAPPRTGLVPGPEDPSEEKYRECKQAGNKSFVSGDYSRAFELYKQGLCHKTNDSALWSNAAAAALRLGDFEGAIKHARVARTVDKKNVKAWYREGQAAEKLSLWEDAASAYYEAFLVNNESDNKIEDVDFAQLVKETVDKGRQEFESKKNHS